MDYEPISVALEFGFLALLYLFLVWVARTSRTDLRRLTAQGPAAPDSTGIHASRAGGETAASREGWLVVSTGGGLEPGERIDVFGGVSIGRSPDADIRINDRYASSIHARVFESAGAFYVEDMQSTNGTLRNGEQVVGEAAIADGDRIRIGDTELIFEGG